MNASCSPTRCAQTTADGVPTLGLAGTRTTLTGSLTGNCVTLIGAATPTVVKHVRVNTTWFPLEQRVTEALLGVDGTAQLVAADPGAHLLATRHIPEQARPWTRSDIDSALATLEALRNRAATLELPTLATRHDMGSDLTRGQSIAVTRGPDAIARLSPRLHEYGPRVRAATATLHAAAHADTPVHTDTHPGNWILTGDRPVLIDFGSTCLGPYGYDETYLISCWDAPVEERLALLTRVGVSDTITIATTVFVLALMSACHDSAHSGAWARTHLPAVRDLAAALM